MKRSFVILILALLALTLTACGGEATTASQGTQPPPTEAQEQPTAPSTSTRPAADQAASATLTAAAHQQAIEGAVQATLTAVAPTRTPAPRPSATAVPATITSAADVLRITVQELKAKLDAGQAVVFDARRRESYVERHIVGAISLPQSQVAARLAELPTDKLAVFYCT